MCAGDADTLLQVTPSSPSHFCSPDFWFLSIFTHSLCDPLLGGRHWFGCEYYTEKDTKPCPQEVPCLVEEKMKVFTSISR